MDITGRDHGAEEDIEYRYIDVNFDLVLSDGWSIIAKRPHSDNPDRRWAYMLYHQEYLVDYGLLDILHINSPAASNTGGITTDEKRRVYDRLRYLATEYRRSSGHAIRGGTSLYGKPSFIK